jgi:hypothetical protein
MHLLFSDLITNTNITFEQVTKHMAIKELMGGLYRTSYRTFKIKFPYKADGTFYFFGTKEGAVEAAGKLQKQIKHMYAPKITEITKSMQ